MMADIAVPTKDEAAEYYFTYIDQVAPRDIRRVLADQGSEVAARLRSLSETQSQYRYAPGKWSVREMIGHVNDAERVFAFRAFWFARGFDLPLPSFDQDVAVGTANADARSLASHIEEFQQVRAASRTLFDALPDEAWARRGVASGNPVTVRALAYICAGHVTHHMRILQERYVPGAAP
jgi:hypothetical protein